MHSLVDMVLDGEEDLHETVKQMADVSGATASFLSKDVEMICVELRAEGTGVVRPVVENTFVSMMDKVSDTVLDGHFGGLVWDFNICSIEIYFCVIFAVRRTRSGGC